VAEEMIEPFAPPEPLVSIGLPVYNGGVYLEESIRSLLGQTYRNIEIVISDNASTDGSQTVCQRFASEDRRISYSRLPENVGGVANHNRVRELARGDFFMWASSDDLWQPSYVQQCVEILLARQDVVLVYSINVEINEHGTHVRDVPPGPRLDSESVFDRFVLLADMYRTIEPFYGLMRRQALLRTAPMVKHPGFDRILLAEIGLLGKLVQIPQALYCRRIHAQQSINAYPSLRSRYRWINPDANGRFVWPYMSYGYHFMMAALRSAPGLKARLACLWHMARWCKWHRSELWGDLVGVE
jgi:glycosyltransferase involved in cell wall biosynthesis